MRRFSIAFILGAALVTTPAFAADPEPIPTRGWVINFSTVDPPAASKPSSNPFASSLVVPAHRPAGLPMLYATAIALQAADAYTTTTALKRGGVEANPVMSGVVKSPGAFMATKAGAAVAAILVTESLWKHGHRMAAIGVMVTSNIAMGLVAANNARVLSTLR